MTKIWMILGLVAIGVALAAVTKNLWFPQGLRDRWNEAWMSYPEDEADPRTALLAEHARRMAALESQYREMIEKEKARNKGLLAEKASLSITPASP
jgi:hypothetical protein